MPKAGRWDLTAMNHDEITKLTDQYGGNWGIRHAERLLHLVPILAEGREYNEEAVWLAAYLHDWGGYAPFYNPEVQHYDRSVEVVEPFLTERDCPEDLKALVIECIANHHGGDPNRSIESRLLADADALDLLGVVGAARTFAMNARDIKGGYDWVKKWRERCLAAITLPKTTELAAVRVRETDEFLRAFEEETFGLF